MALAAATDIWGMTDANFLLTYFLITVAVGSAGLHTRRALADPAARHPLADVTSRPHDVAFLNGGADLAVCSALTAMHLRGTIAPTRGIVHAVGRLEPRADKLEQAIHSVARAGVHRTRLPLHRPVTLALSDVEQRLVAGGLLLSTEERHRIRRVGWWMLAVAALGLVRLLAAVAEGKPVGLLILALLGVTAAAIGQLMSAPRRSRLGSRTLAALRTERAELSPTARPDWVAYGPDVAALSIGLHGTSALWASDPALADELAVQRAAAGSSGSDSSGSVIFGGDGGGGGSDGGGGCGGGGCGGG